MRRFQLRLAAGLLAFAFGASVDVFTRRPGAFPDGTRASARRRVTFILDRPLTSPGHPTETIELLRTARRLG